MERLRQYFTSKFFGAPSNLSSAPRPVRQQSAPLPGAVDVGARSEDLGLLARLRRSLTVQFFPDEINRAGADSSSEDYHEILASFHDEDGDAAPLSPFSMSLLESDEDGAIEDGALIEDGAFGEEQDVAEEVLELEGDDDAQVENERPNSTSLYYVFITMLSMALSSALRISSCGIDDLRKRVALLGAILKNTLFTLAEVRCKLEESLRRQHFFRMGAAAMARAVGVYQRLLAAANRELAHTRNAMKALAEQLAEKSMYAEEYLRKVRVLRVGAAALARGVAAYQRLLAAATRELEVCRDANSKLTAELAEQTNHVELLRGDNHEAMAKCAELDTRVRELEQTNERTSKDLECEREAGKAMQRALAKSREECLVLHASALSDVTLSSALRELEHAHAQCNADLAARAHQEELAACGATHQEELSACGAAHQEELAACGATHQEELSACGAAHQEELAACGAAHEAALSDERELSSALLTQLSEARAHAEELELEACRAVSSLAAKTFKEETARAMFRSKKAELAVMFRSKKAELAASEARASRQLGATKAEAARELSKMKGALVAKDAEVKAVLAANAALEVKNSTLEEMKVDFLRRLAAKEGELAAKEAELAAKEVELAAKEGKLAQAKHEVLQLRDAADAMMSVGDAQPSSASKDLSALAAAASPPPILHEATALRSSAVNSSLEEMSDSLASASTAQKPHAPAAAAGPSPPPPTIDRRITPLDAFEHPTSGLVAVAEDTFEHPTSGLVTAAEDACKSAHLVDKEKAAVSDRTGEESARRPVPVLARRATHEDPALTSRGLQLTVATQHLLFGGAGPMSNSSSHSSGSNAEFRVQRCARGSTTRKGNSRRISAYAHAHAGRSRDVKRSAHLSHR